MHLTAPRPRPQLPHPGLQIAGGKRSPASAIHEVSAPTGWRFHAPTAEVVTTSATQASSPSARVVVDAIVAWGA